MNANSIANFQPVADLHSKSTSAHDSPQMGQSTYEPARNDWASHQGNGADRVAWIHFEIIHGGQTNVRVPVAVTGRYEGLDLAGQAKAFDCQLDSWLSRAIDMGMIGSGLGNVHVLYFDQGDGDIALPRVNVERLVLMGMGIPGQFSPDDARYVTCNAMVAVKCMGFDLCSIPLFGIRRNEMSVERAVRACLLGILDAYDRCRAIADSVKDNRLYFQQKANHPLKIAVVEPKRSRAERILKVLKEFSENGTLPGLLLELSSNVAQVAPDSLPEATATDTDPTVPVTYMRITRTNDGASPILDAPTSRTVNPRCDVFQFSALSDAAAMTVREVEVNSYFVRNLPDRMVATDSSQEREDLGMFLTNYLIPDDFREVVESAPNLTFVVDKSTAQIPWEMAAFKGIRQTNALAMTGCVSRRFHSLMSPAPGSLPPLNKSLKVLIVADPAPSPRLALPSAQREAFAVIDILNKARQVWRGEFDINVTVRIGSAKRCADLKSSFTKHRQNSELISSIEYCDPLKIALLIVNEQFDVIHYAGHGEYDEKANRAGWLLDEDCFLSAQEIFRVRQVPRLVFANACFSAVASSPEESRNQLVGLAQAFFARGIPNYIGTGWQVDDECACECARYFYARLLGLRNPDEKSATGTAPPATIGDALLYARVAVHKLKPSSSTWGAYQHYGRVSDKILPFANSNQDTD